MSEDAEAGDAGTRLRLDIAYDGTGFAGWAKQPGLRTVQGALEDALAQLLARTPPAPTLVVAGRTDAGVHATGQVAHLDLTDEHIASLDRPPRGRAAAADAGEGAHVPSVDRAAAALARRLNGVLGARSDVVVLACAPAPDGFDARFSATWRAYRYRISDVDGPAIPSSGIAPSSCRSRSTRPCCRRRPTRSSACTTSPHTASRARGPRPSARSRS
ncbi:hypothetical protein MAFF212519_20790 [Clavibacter michiganensis]